MAHSLMRWFDHRHLPIHLQLVVADFSALATRVDVTLPDGAEKSACIRKLLEAKDCAVRVRIEKEEMDQQGTT
jgi:hypothetical protein